MILDLLRFQGNNIDLFRHKGKFEFETKNTKPRQELYKNNPIYMYDVENVVPIVFDQQPPIQFYNSHELKLNKNDNPQPLVYDSLDRKSNNDASIKERLQLVDQSGKQSFAQGSSCYIDTF